MMRDMKNLSMNPDTKRRAFQNPWKGIVDSPPKILTIGDFNEKNCSTAITVANCIKHLCRVV